MEFNSEQLVAYITTLSNKDDSQCTPEELKAKKAIAATSAAEEEKKNAEICSQCTSEAQELSDTLNQLVNSQAKVISEEDVIEYNRLKADRKAVDDKKKKFLKNSEAASQYVEVEKEIKKIRSEIASVNKEANDAGIPGAIVPTKRGGRKKKSQPDNGETRPMDTGDNDEDNESDSNEDREGGEDGECGECGEDEEAEN